MLVIEETVMPMIDAVVRVATEMTEASRSPSVLVYKICIDI